tara:strand:- start:19521 stop:20444 length:924 start_codon:yes stop_codon:yes gene_type:complete
MTTEEQNEVTQETEASEDNFLDVLDEFNEETSPELVQESSPEEDPQLPEEPVEQASSDSQEAQEESEWLIEGKFKKDNGGAENLAKSYRELQSKYDKDKNQYSQSVQQMQQKAQIVDALSKDPAKLQAVQNALKQQQAVSRIDYSKPPPKPANYDILDESIDGTDSSRWRGANDAWLVLRGQMAAKQEVGQLRQELNNDRARNAKLSEFQSYGMQEDDIIEYSDFIQKAKNADDATLVALWQHLKSTLPGENSNENTGNVQQAPPKKSPKRTTSAASVSGGSNPPAKKGAEKETDDFWDGIMSFSNS